MLSFFIKYKYEQLLKERSLASVVNLAGLLMLKNVFASKLLTELNKKLIIK